MERVPDGACHVTVLDGPLVRGRALLPRSTAALLKLDRLVLLERERRSVRGDADAAARLDEPFVARDCHRSDAARRHQDGVLALHPGIDVAPRRFGRKLVD